ncbi:MAG TPA: hypothetical protein DCP31_21365 [Cyanobacteria bacterium UBA8543]|nr:hypothetical protein [Cyanobacteria bacterium UBA8543]
MSVALYMDEHVHKAITEGLRQRGVDVLTVQEDDRRNTPDDILLDRAMELGRVMFSQDRDLLIEAQRRQVEGIVFVGVIYAHQVLVTIGICVRDLELIAKATDLEDYANRVEYLPM